jgi:hypothetical protein
LAKAGFLLRNSTARPRAAAGSFGLHVRVQGFLGWALTPQALAEQWVEGRAGLGNKECREGDSVIVNAFAAETSGANRFIVDTMRKLFASKCTLYFKRHYPDGRTRPVRLSVNEFVGAHLARSIGRRDKDEGPDPGSASGLATGGRYGDAEALPKLVHPRAELTSRMRSPSRASVGGAGAASAFGGGKATGEIAGSAFLKSNPQRGPGFFGDSRRRGNRRRFDPEDDPARKHPRVASAAAAPWAPDGAAMI